MSTPPQPQQYTAAQLAGALGLSKRSIIDHLSSARPCGVLVVRGNEAPTWSINTLPSNLKDRIQSRVSEMRFRDAHALIEHHSRPWEPPIPISEVAPAFLQEALKLRQAMAEPLAQRNQLSGADLDNLGLEWYQRVFGHTVTAKHWRNLLNRTLERDGGRQDFERLEIYLSDRLARAQSAPDQAAAKGLQAELQDALPASVTPSAEEIQYLWYRCFDLYQDRVAMNEPGDQVKRSILQFLHNYAPYLNPKRSMEALRKKFERKYQAWVESECSAKALDDQRKFASGNHRRPELIGTDREILLARCMECGGRISQGWRKAFQSGELSAEFTRYYISQPASKSYVPRAIRNDLAPDVARLMDIHHGPRQAKLYGVSRVGSKGTTPGRNRSLLAGQNPPPGVFSLVFRHHYS